MPTTRDRIVDTMETHRNILAKPSLLRGSPMNTTPLQFALLVVSIILVLPLAGCLDSGSPRLEFGELWYALSPDPQGGMYMLFNFTVYNNGSAAANNVYVSIDGLNRTPLDANHYGRSERTLEQIPADGSFVIAGRLDVYSTCRLADPSYAMCSQGQTFFTIRAQANEGEPAVKQVLQTRY